jgi:hypothetical protein
VPHPQTPPYRIFMNVVDPQINNRLFSPHFEAPLIFLYLSMKTILRTGLVVLLMLAIKTGATAQVNIDETNLITRLSGLNALTIADAGKYFTDHNYSLFDKGISQLPTYSVDLYTYKIKGQTDRYCLNVIAGQITSSGIITYNDDEYQQAMKAIKDMGYVPGKSPLAEYGETIYEKGNMHFIVQKKAFADGRTFCAMSLVDVLKFGQLSGAKK